MCTNTNFSHCSLLGRRSRDAALPLRQLVRRRVPHKSQGPGLRLMRAEVRADVILTLLYSSVSELNPFNPCRGHSALLISALQSPITMVHPG